MAGTARQTEWSGGRGVPGPVAGWGSEWCMAEEVNWSGAPEQMTLLPIPVDPIGQTVDDGFDPYAVYSSDVNGDGHLDVAGASLWHDWVGWWANVDGLGTTWAGQLIDNDF